MDTETGKIINPTPDELVRIEKEWEAWRAGLLKKRPRYVPVDGDRVPFDASKYRKGGKGGKVKKTYRDYCH